MRFRLEQLEPRRLLATVTQEGLIVKIEGTEQADSIVVAVSDGDLVFSGSDVRVTYRPDLRIEARLLGGDDSLTNDTDLPALVYGGDGNDKLIGGSGRDSLYGEAGDDFLDGRAGDDDLSGGGQSGDIHIGGDGFDNILGITAKKIDTILFITGTAGRDEIRIVDLPEQPGNFRIDGKSGTWSWSMVDTVEFRLGDGDDVFSGETTGTVRVFGEGGNDSLSNSGPGLLNGGAGVNVVQGSTALNSIYWANRALSVSGTEGNDRLIIRNVDGEVSISGHPLTWSNVSSITVDGLGGNDRIVNQTQIPVVRLLGGAGNDIVVGSSRASELDGGAGDDFLLGGAGNDTLLGGAGNDRLYASAGNDTLDGGAGDDRLLGGTGNDRYLFATGAGWERDTIVESALSDAQNRDALDFRNVAVGVTVTFVENRGQAVDAHRELRIQGSAAEAIYGGSADDVIHGHNNTTIISGREGNDQLFGKIVADVDGGDGNDLIVTTGGSAYLWGANGDDRIIAGGSGNNQISGGAGNDILTGGAGNDTIDGGTGEDLIYGMGGNDTLMGGGGADRLEGGAGNDVLVSNYGTYTRDGFWIIPENDNNILIGGPGDDILYGSRGQDQLSGGPGFDTIQGDQGEDTLLDGTHDDGDLLDSIEIFPVDYWGN